MPVDGSASLPSPKQSNGWIQYQDAAGNPYIFHPVTQTSLWGVLATGGGDNGGSPRVGSSPSAAPSPTMQNVYNLSVSTSSPSGSQSQPQPDRTSQFTSPRKASPASGVRASPPRGPYTPGPLTPPSLNPFPQSHHVDVTTDPGHPLPSKPHHYIRRLYDDTSCSESEAVVGGPPSSSPTAGRRADRARRRAAVKARRARAVEARDRIVAERLARDADLDKLKREREELQRRIQELEESGRRTCS